MTALAVDDTDVRAAYRHCEQVTRTQARNFSYGIRLLPAPKRRALATRIRRRADVIIGRTRRVYLQRQARRLLCSQVPQHALGRRTAANVAETHKKDFVTALGHCGLQQG